MSPKAQPSKQKRAAQNRNQRAARAARAANAQAAGPSPAGTTPSGGGSLLSRLTGRGTTPAAPRAGARPVPGLQPPGFRAALSALLAAVAAILLCSLALRYPVDASGELYTRESLAADWTTTALRAVAEDPDAEPADIASSIDEWTPGKGEEVVVQALWPYSLALVLPLLGAGLGFQAVRRRSSSRTVNRALYATLFGAVLTQGLLLLFLPVVLAMGVAMFQVRRAEAQAAAMAGGGGTEVIDVDEAPAAPQPSDEPVDDD